MSAEDLRKIIIKDGYVTQEGIAHHLGTYLGFINGINGTEGEEAAVKIFKYQKMGGIDQLRADTSALTQVLKVEMSPEDFDCNLGHDGPWTQEARELRAKLRRM